MPRLPKSALERSATFSSSPPQQQLKDTFYTAQWGSPYDLSSSHDASEAGKASHRRRSESIADGSPLRSWRELGTGETLPYPNDSQSIRRAFTGNEISTPTKRAARSNIGQERYDLTGDWIRKYKRERIEKRTWLSDESDSGSSGSYDGNLGASQEVLQQTDFQSNSRTPKASQLNSNVLQERPANFIGKISRKEHHQKETLTQQAFNKIVRESSQSTVERSKMLSALMTGAIPRRDRRSSATSEKPLPPAPINRTASEAPVASSQKTDDRPPAPPKRPSISSMGSFLTPRRTIQWRGKKCVITLPLEVGKGSDGKPKKPLTPEEVAIRMRGWEAEGYSNRGFDLSEESSGVGIMGQSRGIFPDPTDFVSDIRSKSFRVRIPNNRAFDEMKNQRQEDILRSLGVTRSDEQPARASPGVASMSRQTSSQNSYPASLSSGPSALNQFRSPLESTFSPPLTAPNPQFPFTQPVISPVAAPSNPRSAGFHLPNHSMAFSPGQVPYAGAPFAQPTPPLPGVQQPQHQQHLGSVPSSRGVSPLIDGRRQSIRVSSSPVSPLPDVGADGYFNVLTQPPTFLRQQAVQMHPALIAQQVSHQQKPPLERQASSKLGVQQPITYVSQPDIASPLPQGHRHNVSETLQKEIDEAEYHLEKTIARQLEEEEERGSKIPEGDDNLEGTGKGKAVPAKASSDAHTADSVIDTNPSVVNSPLLGSAGLELSSGHTSKTSSSRLNVKAQEFVFDPAKSSFASMFTFGDRSVVPSGPTSATSASGTEAPHSAKTSNASTFGSGLNVAAPAFVPGQTQAQQQALSNPVFSFSSTLPGSKPSGLSSTPGYAFNSSALDETASRAPASRIFSDVAQPPKESRAIPIVKPEENLEHDEDESGRIGPAAGREKRMRRNNPSGDAIPLFAAMPSEVPSMPEEASTLHKDDRIREETEVQPILELQGISTPQPAPLISTGDKAVEESLNTADYLQAPTNPASPSTPAEKATNQLKALVDETDNDSVKADDGPRVQGPVEDPFTVGDNEDDIATDKSRAESPPASSAAERADDGAVATANGAAVAPRGDLLAETETSIPKSILSATAKSFSFNPAVSAFKPLESHPVTPLTARSQLDEAVERSPISGAGSSNPAPKKPTVIGGLGASKYASQEPSPPAKHLSPPSRSENERDGRPDPRDEIVVEFSEDSTSEGKFEPTRTPSSDISPKAGLRDSTRPETPSRELDERIINGAAYLDSTSFQEIDDVIQQLNGDDSDAGVERNPGETWRSPARKVIDERRYSSSSQHVSREYLSDVESRLERSPTRVTASPNRLSQPFQYLPAEAVEMSDSAADAAAELIARNPRDSPSFRKPRRSSGSPISPVRRLNRVEDGSISEWNDVVSSGEEAAFNQRVGFFDNRVSHVIANAIEDRLQPLETALSSLTAQLTRKSERSRSRRYQRSASADAENSDADDEDDEIIPGRAISPFLKDRKYEKLRTLLLEVVSSQRPAASEETSHVLETLAELKSAIVRQQQEPGTSKNDMGNEAMTKITEAISELKASIAQQSAEPVPPSTTQNEDLANVTKAIAQLQTSIEQQKSRPQSPQDIKAVVEEALARHGRKLASGNSASVRTSGEAAAVEKLHLQVNGLESMLKIQESRASDEYKLRREVEDRLAESQRELKVALAEASQSRDAAEETEASLRSFLDDQQQSKQHLAHLEEVQVSMEKNLSDMTEKNNALEDTISEYRISHDEWRREMDDSKTDNENLQRTISALKEELEDGIRTKQTLKEKFERLQDDVVQTTQKVAADQASWRHRDEEHKARHELSSARLEAEARTRERLELEIERLEKQERESMKARVLVEQVRSENSNLSAIVNDLRAKSHQHQERSLAFERELHDTKERAHLEVQRISNLTKGDVEAANQQVQLVKANLEGSISRLESQLEATKDDAKLAKDRHELMLEEASASKDTALREAAEAREAALQEHYRFHERTLGETTASHDRSMTELKTSHERVFHDTVEDHRRAVNNLVEDHKRHTESLVEEKRISEQELKSRLSLSDEKLLHLQDKVAHLTERLAIAQSAAQAAATAARTARSSTPQPHSSKSVLPSMQATSSSPLPDKISPQALRESILVLQEQLHERESRIEKLEADFAAIDHDAPQKVKERDIEITWLRELLGVRLDDLQDIIDSLSSPAGFDREAVRNAAIRLKTSLQMEQQEKERAMANGGASQRMPTLSSLAASPRSLPLAAAAAWGSWRKGQTSLSSLAEMAVPSAASSANQTPSKSSPQSFLFGLLTPPSTNVRSTPQPRPGSSRRAQQPASSIVNADQPFRRRPLAGYSTPKRQISGTVVGNLIPPETPTLLRQQSYDPDADEKDHHYSMERYVTDPPGEDSDEPESLAEAGSESNMANGVLKEGKGKGKELAQSGLSMMEEPQELFGPSIELES